VSPDVSLFGTGWAAREWGGANRGLEYGALAGLRMRF
jgi:hypothetical protein